MHPKVFENGTVEGPITLGYCAGGDHPIFESAPMLIAVKNGDDSVECLGGEPSASSVVFDLTQPSGAFSDLLGGGSDGVAVHRAEPFNNESVVRHVNLAFVGFENGKVENRDPSPEVRKS